jgi:hypothetical protein
MQTPSRCRNIRAVAVWSFRSYVAIFLALSSREWIGPTDFQNKPELWLGIPNFFGMDWGGQ